MLLWQDEERIIFNGKCSGELVFMSSGLTCTCKYFLEVSIIANMVDIDMTD